MVVDIEGGDRGEGFFFRCFRRCSGIIVGSRMLFGFGWLRFGWVRG